jgi:fibronectin-binding autotransporter adhesin
VRIRQVLALLFLLCGFLSTKTYGQVVATWTDGNGNWSNAANWSTNTVPNNTGSTTYDAVINQTGATTVTFDASGTVINSLTLGPIVGFGETAPDTLQGNGSSQSLTAASLTSTGTINWGNGSNLAVASLTNNVGGIVNVTGLGTLVSSGIYSRGLISLNNSNLTLNGNYNSDMGASLQLQNGSSATIAGSASSGNIVDFSGFLVDKSSLSVGGDVNYLGGTVTNGSTLKIQGGLIIPEGNAFTIQGSSAVIGGITASFQDPLIIDSSTLSTGGISIGFSRASIQNGSSVIAGGIGLGSGDQSLFSLDGTSSLKVLGGFSNGFASSGFASSSINGSFTVGGTLSNGANGRIGISGPATIYAIQNSGFMSVGQMTVNGGGIINNVGGTLYLSGPETVAGGFTNSGGDVHFGATITADNYSQSSGSTDISGTLATSSYRQGGGTTTIENGGLLTAKAFTATGGTVTVNGILDPTAVEFGSGAALQGTGTIIGNVAMGGTIIPGVPGTPGTLTIMGNYEQIGNGTFDELIGANSASPLNVTGDAALDSDSLLKISLLSGFNPLGQTFGIMDYRSLVGQFSNGSSFLDDGYVWDISYGRNEIYVTAVSTPEPSSLLLLFVGLSTLVFCAHRKLEKMRRLA